MRGEWRLRAAEKSATQMNADKKEFMEIARRIAAHHGLWPELVCAVIEQESGWNCWALRYEPGFYERYVAPMLERREVKRFSPGVSLETEARGRAFSWGLMQVMGQVARERGFLGAFFSELCDPEQGIEIGCRHLNNRIGAAQGNVERALQLWNGGGNATYSAEVLARVAHYQ